MLDTGIGIIDSVGAAIWGDPHAEERETRLTRELEEERRRREDLAREAATGIGTTEIAIGAGALIVVMLLFTQIM